MGHISAMSVCCSNVRILPKVLSPTSLGGKLFVGSEKNHLLGLCYCSKNNDMQFLSTVSSLRNLP